MTNSNLNSNHIILFIIHLYVHILFLGFSIYARPHKLHSFLTYPAQNKGCLSVWLSVLDFLLILPVKLPVVDRMYPQSNNFTGGGESDATGDSKLNDSPEGHMVLYQNIHGL